MVVQQSNRFFEKIQDINWSIVILSLLVVFMGIIMMYSAAQGNMHPWAYKQLIHLAVAFPLMCIIAMTNINFWYDKAYIIYGCALLLLIFVEILGHKAMGATRWINLGFIKLQPSEPMKIALVLALARYFHGINYNDINKYRTIIIPLILILLPFLLIIKQPDLGTAMLLLFVGTIMLFAIGIAIWKFVLVGVVALSSMPVLWHFLHEYQKKRILTFLDPERDPLGAGYNIIQSKIAIGSGGFWGKGLLQGTQSQLDFLPEHQTDFIFTMFLEEMGFIGGAILLIIYFSIFWKAILIAMNARSNFAKYSVIGSVSIMFVHVFINMAMVTGLVPAVGIPLPFMTYGGTIMITIMICLGLIQNGSVYSRNRITTTINIGRR
jgi:rod shape determining protein RodA